MKNRFLFGISALGVVLACVAAYFFARQKPAQPPLFEPASNPYSSGIYAEGIIESNQPSGSNTNIYPEVAGTVLKILVHEGDIVHKGDTLLRLDTSVPLATAQQALSQAAASRSALAELEAQPRKEVFDVTSAQLKAATASLKTASDAYAKQEVAFRADSRTVSRDALDAAADAVELAKANVEIAERQVALTKAGAWSYDIQNQRLQAESLQKAAESAQALLSKYTLKSPSDGTVLAVGTSEGSYISSQGSYNPYSQGAVPVIILGSSDTRLQVRCYVDEILVARIPDAKQIKAQMTVRGTRITLPLKMEHIQPLVSPKIELADQRQERVDVRVLPMIFSFQKPSNVILYPGELVDVYIGH